MSKRVYTKPKDMTEQLEELSRIEVAMREKVEEQIPHFRNMSVVQLVTSTQGEKVLKANPAMQEIRALFRDYAAIVKMQSDLLEGGQAAQSDSVSLEDMRARFKIAK